MNAVQIRAFLVFYSDLPLEEILDSLESIQILAHGTSQEVLRAIET